MEIKYLGHSSFVLRSKIAKLVTDPFNPEIGLRFPKTEANIITISHYHKDHNNASQVEGNPLVIDMPGEFEKNGFRITGFQSFHDNKKGAERGENVIYKIEVEGMSFLHCGDLGYVPEGNFIDEVGKIDVLFVPVGGTYTIDAGEAVELVKEIEPSIVIPMHYKTPKHDTKQYEQIQTVEEFLKKIGAEDIAPVEKLVIKKEDLGEEMKVVVMES